jgi:hypothetical protein
VIPFLTAIEEQVSSFFDSYHAQDPSAFGFEVRSGNVPDEQQTSWEGWRLVQSAFGLYFVKSAADIPHFTASPGHPSFKITEIVLHSARLLSPDSSFSDRATPAEWDRTVSRVTMVALETGTSGGAVTKIGAVKLATEEKSSRHPPFDQVFIASCTYLKVPFRIVIAPNA